MSKPHIPINGSYPVIVIEYLGQTMRDLNLTDCDVICWNPSMYIDCKKIDIQRVPHTETIYMNAHELMTTSGRALCNLTVMRPNTVRHMAEKVRRSLSLLTIFLRVDKPLFICSRQVAQVLGLDEDGDAIYIREVGE